jgi:trehalose/maltose transport system substrate-binding protein
LAWIATYFWPSAPLRIQLLAHGHWRAERAMIYPRLQSEALAVDSKVLMLPAEKGPSLHSRRIMAISAQSRIARIISWAKSVSKWPLGVCLLGLTLSSCRHPAPTPVSLNYLRTGWIRQEELPAIDALQRKFTSETGLGLRHLHGVQEETADQLTLTRRLLQEGSSGPDVLEIDETWLGVLQEDLIDLRPYLAAEISSIGPGLASSYIVNGKVVAIPYQNNAGMLVYRADLLREYGYAHPPATWDELEKMALRIQAGERAKGNKHFWGYVWAGAAAESLTCGALEWQMSEGGGTIVEGNRTISVNNPAAIRSWQRARHWIGWISPPSTAQYLETDARNVFFSGAAAFIREWGGALGGLPTTADQLRLVKWGYKLPVGEAGYATLPAGSFASVGTLGGQSLGVSRYSLHPREDAELIRFLLREHTESFQNGAVPNLSAGAAVYHFSSSLDSHGNSSGQSNAVVVSRPSGVAGRTYDQVSKAYSKAIHSVLTGEKRAPESASELEQYLVRITGFAAGPLRKNQVQPGR